MTDPAPADLETTSWARRILALMVDWAACTLIVVLIIGTRGWSEDQAAGFYTLGVFVVESALLTALAGGSFGQLSTRLRVIRADGEPGPPDLARAFARQVMIALVIPPLVYRSDGRGLHDIAAGTATVDLPTFLARRVPAGEGTR